MSKIKWMGSLSYSIAGKELKFNEIAELDENLISLLPAGKYSVVREPVAVAKENESSEKELEEKEDALNEGTEVYTEAQSKYFKEHTLAQLKEKSKEIGIDIPNFIVKKADLFDYMLDNGLVVE